MKVAMLRLRMAPLLLGGTSAELNAQAAERTVSVVPVFSAGSYWRQDAQHTLVGLALEVGTMRWRPTIGFLAGRNAGSLEAGVITDLSSTAAAGQPYVGAGLAMYDFYTYRISGRVGYERAAMGLRFRIEAKLYASPAEPAVLIAVTL